MGVNRRIGVRRTSYPSGAWVDEHGNPASSPNSSYTPSASLPAMPVPRTVTVTGNPNPDNYKVVKAKEMLGHLILQLNYPDCVNYEGNKILVFKGVTLIDLINQRKIDPHFFKNSQYKSPIARFEPTDLGWQMAEVFVNAWATVRTR